MCSRLSTPAVSEWSFCLHKYDVENPMVSLLLQFVSVEESLCVLTTSHLLAIWSFVSCVLLVHSPCLLANNLKFDCIVCWLLHVFCETQCWSFKITFFSVEPLHFCFFKASLCMVVHYAIITYFDCRELIASYHKL